MNIIGFLIAAKDILRNVNDILTIIMDIKDNLSPVQQKAVVDAQSSLAKMGIFSNTSVSMAEFIGLSESPDYTTGYNSHKDEILARLVGTIAIFHGPSYARLLVSHLLTSSAIKVNSALEGAVTSPSQTYMDTLTAWTNRSHDPGELYNMSFLMNILADHAHDKAKAIQDVAKTGAGEIPYLDRIAVNETMGDSIKMMRPNKDKENESIYDQLTGKLATIFNKVKTDIDIDPEVEFMMDVKRNINYNTLTVNNIIEVDACIKPRLANKQFFQL